ncbi:enoyl-CoA hydratase/isomerase family protein [Paractinoplanes brasiliensis]|uniref:Enoyl-CoA hydratase/carnithine racemase n=1 Tax=Paractinoplanes brasiliensis TaxID=52695 RepID=A0A4R6JBX1_9ACTN|nr:enoyl-CoA hydratase/isomerase family protein [Actinoplanes brasiliensis]TDO32797.1 enoyl-CoA hydratase/carnithine racemase [Actinoplanes brasiliensis]GID31658.1 enoyl-CoA hydratase [Actinoplanes brasiliensis]
MKQFTVDAVTSNVRRVTFTSPPFNLIGADTLAELSGIVDRLSGDEQVSVVIFDSGTPGFFLNHVDSNQIPAIADMAGNGFLPGFVEVGVRLAAAPFVSIASIRGRTRGGGAEYTAAFDLRYASRERAVLGQPEVGFGLVPGAGGTERLAHLLGRDRALEVLLTGQDYDADRAAEYGWVTRAIPDAELDDFVNAVARRIAGFGKQAVTAIKTQVNRSTLPPEEDLLASFAESVRSTTGPDVAARGQALGELIARIGIDDLERNLGHHLGAPAEQP